jgi:hypothetical protein
MEAFRKSLAAVVAETANDDGKPAKAARPKKPKAKATPKNYRFMFGFRGEIV